MWWLDICKNYDKLTLCYSIVKGFDAKSITPTRIHRQNMLAVLQHKDTCNFNDIYICRAVLRSKEKIQNNRLVFSFFQDNIIFETNY